MKYNYHVKVRVGRPDNRYWAYHNATGACVSPEEGRATSPAASLDAKLDFRYHTEAWYGVDPVLQEIKDEPSVTSSPESHG